MTLDALDLFDEQQLWISREMVKTYAQLETRLSVAQARKCVARLVELHTRQIQLSREVIKTISQLQ